MFARIALITAMTATPVLAEGSLGEKDFDAYVTGKTITYDYGGGVFGVEQYLAGRQVRWAFEGDICINGSWYQEGDQICFVYENDGTPQCWEFYKESQGLSATYMTGDSFVISEIGQSSKPLPCSGPDVGA